MSASLRKSGQIWRGLHEMWMKGGWGGLLNPQNIVYMAKSWEQDALFFTSIRSTSSSPESSPKSAPALETDSSSSAYTDTMLGRWPCQSESECECIEQGSYEPAWQRPPPRPPSRISEGSHTSGAVTNHIDQRLNQMQSSNICYSLALAKLEIWLNYSNVTSKVAQQWTKKQE